jgi:hypothetical protein
MLVRIQPEIISSSPSFWYCFRRTREACPDRIRTQDYAWALCRSEAWKVNDPADVELFEVQLLSGGVTQHRCSDAAGSPRRRIGQTANRHPRTCSSAKAKGIVVRRAQEIASPEDWDAFWTCSTGRMPRSAMCPTPNRCCVGKWRCQWISFAMFDPKTCCQQ